MKGERETSRELGTRESGGEGEWGRGKRIEWRRGWEREICYSLHKINQYRPNTTNIITNLIPRAYKKYYQYFNTRKQVTVDCLISMKLVRGCLK